MSDIKRLTKLAEEFRDARDWKQFHNQKDLSISLALEAAEVMEHFLWKSKEEMEEYVRTNKKDIGSELADVLYCALLMASDINIDIISAFEEKMKENDKKYPIEKARGKNAKYTAYID